MWPGGDVTVIADDDLLLCRELDLVLTIVVAALIVVIPPPNCSPLFAHVGDACGWNRALHVHCGQHRPDIMATGELCTQNNHLDVSAVT